MATVARLKACERDPMTSDPVTRPVIVVVPRGGLDVEYRLLDVVEHVEVLVEDRLDLDEATEDLGAALAGKVRHLRLVALLATREVHLTLAHLQRHADNAANDH